MRFAERYLTTLGLPITGKPAPDVTHLLLPVPAFPAGDQYLPHILSDLPENVTISGGNLYSPQLFGYHTIDFLQDPYYLAQNAAITAEATMKIIRKDHSNLADIPVLILGWGRIGKCLTHQLAHLNAPLSVFARRPEDRAMLRALGYTPIDPESLSGALSRFRCIVNTVPAPVLSQADEQQISEDCYKLDLASVCCLPGSNAHHAKGLPGKYKPESSGKLIANTILYHIGGEKT
jgi:dipicolinate synthase subunit A